MHADSNRCGRLPESEYVELAVEVFAMLADATRVRIIMALRDAEELSAVDRRQRMIEDQKNAYKSDNGGK